MQIFWSLIPPPPPAVQSYMETLSTLCSHCSQHNTLSLHKTETNYSDVLSAVERWPECRREASAPICHGSLSPSCQPRQISERCWKLCKHKYTDYFYFINFLLGDWMKKWWSQLAYHGGDEVKQWRICSLAARWHAPGFCALCFVVLKSLFWIHLCCPKFLCGQRRHWSKVPPSPPQLCRKVSNLGGVLSRIIREAALHSAQLQAARSPLRRDCGRCGDLTFKTVGIWRWRGGRSHANCAVIRR